VRPPPALAPGDPIGRLPPAAAAKLRGFRDREADVAAALNSIQDRRNDAVQDRARAEQRIGQLARMQVGPEHPSLAEAEQQRDGITAEVAELDRHIAELRGRRSPLIRRLEDWLRSLPPGTPIEAHDQPPPKLAKGQTPVRAVEALREQLGQLRADLRDVQAAPVPSGTVKQRVRDQVTALAERGCPNVGHAVEIGAAVAFPAPVVRADLFGHAAAEGAPRLVGFAQAAHVDPVALVAWLFPDRLAERLEAEVDALADDSAALTDEERAAREAELRAQLLELERAEEVLVELAERDGTQVARRPDADPRAVLHLSSDLPGAR
jgi:hypothetical protein